MATDEQLSLAKFLLARLDERAAKAQRMLAALWPKHVYVNPTRHEEVEEMLADVESKRRIIDRYEHACQERDRLGELGDALVRGTGGASASLVEKFTRHEQEAKTLEPVVRLLTLPDAAHPDYRPEWAP